MTWNLGKNFRLTAQIRKINTDTTDCIEVKHLFVNKNKKVNIKRRKYLAHIQLKFLIFRLYCIPIYC